MEVFRQRLEDDSGIPVLITAPTVAYKARMKPEQGGHEIDIQSSEDFPDPYHVEKFFQPMVHGTIIAPEDMMGNVLRLCDEHHGEQMGTEFIGGGRIIMKYDFPLATIIADFYSKLKSISGGLASFDYDEAEWTELNLNKIDTLINGKPVGALSVLTSKEESYAVARRLVDKLQKQISRQQFEVVIQAAVGTKIIARARLAAYRKDVLDKSGKSVSGLDRKRKLLDGQKEGKKRLKAVGNVNVPQQAFMEVLKV